jgi:hypothetical protein
MVAWPGSLLARIEPLLQAAKRVSGPVQDASLLWRGVEHLIICQGSLEAQNLAPNGDHRRDGRLTLGSQR